MQLFGFNISRASKLPKSGDAFKSLHSSNARGRVPGPAPTDDRREFTEYTRNEVLRMSRFFDKRSGLIRGIAQDMALYSVGDGIRPQAATGDKTWNREAEKVWRDWSRRASVCGRFSLNELDHIVSRALDRDGEIFAVFTWAADSVTPAVQLIEAHRCLSGENPPDGMVDGILFNSAGAPILYRFLQDDGNTVDIPAQGVRHVFDAESISAARARPSVTHGLDRVLDVREAVGATTKGIKDQLQTPRVVIAPNEDVESIGHALGDTVVQGGPDLPTAEQLNAALGGSSMILPQGSQVVNLASNLPNPTFTGFTEYLHREVTSGVLPYEFTQDASKIGGAVVRLVTGKADRCFSHRQNILISRFLDHVWSYVIAAYIANGMLAESDEFWRVSWVTPRRVTVDAGRDAKANRDDIIAGIKTWGDHFAELGADFEEEMTRRADQAAFIRELAASRGIPESMLYNPSPNSAPQMAQPDADAREPDEDDKPDATNA